MNDEQAAELVAQYIERFENEILPDEDYDILFVSREEYDNIRIKAGAKKLESYRICFVRAYYEIDNKKVIIPTFIICVEGIIDSLLRMSKEINFTIRPMRPFLTLHECCICVAIHEVRHHFQRTPECKMHTVESSLNHGCDLVAYISGLLSSHPSLKSEGSIDTTEFDAVLVELVCAHFVILLGFIPFLMPMLITSNPNDIGDVIAKIYDPTLAYAS